MNIVPRPLRAGVAIAVTVGAVAARYLPRIVRGGYDMLAERGERVLHRGDRHETRPADPEVVQAVVDPYEVGEQVQTPGAVLAHDELPLPDYDHLTIGSLRARIRKLTPAELVQLRDYERAHADRLSVITLFENRLRALQETQTG